MYLFIRKKKKEFQKSKLFQVKYQVQSIYFLQEEQKVSYSSLKFQTYSKKKKEKNYYNDQSLSINASPDFNQIKIL